MYFLSKLITLFVSMTE